jgi:pimeloyl-ACP methyl ester carboxylesterase
VNRTKLGALGLVLTVAMSLIGLPGPSGLTSPVSARPAAVAAAFPPVDGNFSQPGPFSVTVEPGDAAHTIYRPTDLGAGGLRHPVILWGNGTGGSPLDYDALLRHWASHGFVVAAANTPNAGSGQAMLAGATLLIDENGRPGSPYFQKIDVDHIGAAGHSQGGGGAIVAGADARVDTVVPIQPGPQGFVPSLRGPMFILAGQDDTIVSPSSVVFRYNRATQIPAVYGELAGADHFVTVGDGGGFRGMTTAWFRFWLMGDEQARGQFFGPTATCGLCNDSAWSDVRRNTRALAIPGPS